LGPGTRHARHAGGGLHAARQRQAERHAGLHDREAEAHGRHDVRANHAGLVRAVSTARVGTVDLYYEEHGSGDPLLLIIGLAADARAWLFQLPDFARRYRTIVFDNRGVGRSSKPSGPYTIHEMADDAAGLLETLDVARAHVVGVSMGGMIAQE